jgi:hypothetical protein
MVACHIVSQYVSHPIPEHFVLLLQVLGYLVATSSYGMVYVDPSRPDYHDFYAGTRSRKGIPDVLSQRLASFVDSDWANDPIYRRSRGRTFFSLMAPVCW